MIGSKTKLMIIAGVLALAMTGCQGGLHGPGLFGGIHNGAACPPGPKACPRNMYPEFPLPPGGPYLSTPANVGTAQAGPSAPMNLNLGVLGSSKQISVKQAR